MMCQFLELSCYFLAAAHKSGNLEAQRGKQSTKCSKLIAQRTLCSEKHPLFGLWKFLDPRCPGPDTTVLLAASTSVFAPTFSCPDSQSPGSLHPPKLPIYLITPGGGNSVLPCTLNYSHAWECGQLDSRRNERKIIFNFKENPRYLYTVNI